MNFPDQYHAAAVWQQHILDEKNQRRLAELVAQRQRRRPRRSVRSRATALARWVARRRTPVAAPASPSSSTSPSAAQPSRPVGCAV